ncbi:1,4-alpha-glucan branching protein GlgB [Thalassotalea sp. PLHSN55]|uniref:1,4-alpha-glucan branching protein GlgB n=1 Tax=Thalassotalea sp. PLHSN55 TaxID=3435888 RepID=UPI003F82965D
MPKNNQVTTTSLPDYFHFAEALENACFEDIFSFLGAHLNDDGTVCYRVFFPEAEQVTLLINNQEFLFSRYQLTHLFYLELPKTEHYRDYQLKVQYAKVTVTQYDCYAFDSTLDLDAMYLFNEGTLAHAHHHLGAQKLVVNGVTGVRFAVWAPNAKSVSVVNDLNHWDARCHVMRKHPGSGVWELFIADVDLGENYKYSILTHTHQRLEKADPFAFQMQLPPHTASVTSELAKARPTQTESAVINQVDQAISIYEVHLGSWRRIPEQGNRYLNYRELAEQLIPYVVELGFTHIQLMPITEYPFDGSWGYQPIGMFSPTHRFGSIDDFSFFVQAVKAAGLGLLADWVPAHFPSDPHGLATFDGSHLFEHADSRQGYHPDWQTHIYNYDRAEVRSYLLSNATFWIENFQLDGLRVDAVASMLYLDYSREEGQWLPNKYGGRENLAAISLLQQINQSLYQNNPDIMMVAEESTSWPGVTQLTTNGGLGFGYKWNMGWMNDSLSYMSKDPIYRQHHHHEMTFSMIYAYSENYILPLSHDEVVHGKGSLINKMPGDDWQKFANLRAYYGFMWAHPGKKLLFMGSEFAQYHEWDHDHSLDWHLLDTPKHQGVKKLITDLNGLYKNYPALHQCDNNERGFSWVDQNNHQQSIFSFVRYDREHKTKVICISNMTPNVHHHFELGVPEAGAYQVILNTDSAKYGGSDIAPENIIKVFPKDNHGFSHSISLTIAPLASYYLLSIADEH